jgi:choline dehydrogenase-like flavoprotein
MPRPPAHETVGSRAEAEKVSWDAVIVGTGMGGASLGLALAQAGKRVVFVEKGRDLADPDTLAIRGRAPEADPAYRRSTPSERRGLLARAGRMTEEVIDVTRRHSVLPVIGCGTGGSSALYGMVLERFFATDFEPRARHGRAGKHPPRGVAGGL